FQNFHRRQPLNGYERVRVRPCQSGHDFALLIHFHDGALVAGGSKGIAVFQAFDIIGWAGDLNLPDDLTLRFDFQDPESVWVWRLVVAQKDVPVLKAMHDVISFFTFQCSLYYSLPLGS